MSSNTPHTFCTWLIETRIHYLDFIRNLTPQIALASLAWVLALKLDFTTIDLSNWLQTLAFYVFLATFIWAFWANATLFLERSFPEFAHWRKSEKGNFLVLLIQVLKNRPVEGILSAAMLVLLQFILGGVIASSIAATMAFIRATH